MRFVLMSTVVLLATAAHAETIVASVNGMVCAICATGNEKSFKKEASIAKVKVDLEGKAVTLQTKGSQTLDDATVTKHIIDAGYSVTTFTRAPLLARQRFRRPAETRRVPRRAGAVHL